MHVDTYNPIISKHQTSISLFGSHIIHEIILTVLGQFVFFKKYVQYFVVPRDALPHKNKPF